MRIYCKVLISAFLVLSASLAFAQAKTVNELKGKTAKVVIWTHEDANRAPLEKAYIAEFMKANPGVSIDYVTYPSDKITEIVTTAFAAGKGPTVFNVELQNAYPFLTNGRIAPVDYKALGYHLSGVSDLKSLIDYYAPKMLDPVTSNGAIYGLPLELNNWTIYIDKKMFRDAGLNPDKDYPKTWEDVMAVSEKIVQRNGQIITRRGFDFRYPYYLNSVVPMVEQLGGKLISDDGKTAIIGDDAWLKVLNYFKSFGPKGKNLGAPTYTTTRAVFGNGKNEAAMAVSGLYQEARIKKLNQAFYDSKDWMVIPYPQWKDAKVTVPANYYFQYYMVNTQAKPVEQQSAWAVLGYMLSHSEEYLAKVNITPPTKALFSSKTFKSMPYSDVFLSDLNKAHVVYYGAASAKIDILLKQAFESVMLSDTDAKTALAKLRKDANAALADEE